MNKEKILIVILLLCLSVIDLVQGAVVCAEDVPDLVEFMLPGNIPMHFRAVYLGIDGDAVFSSRRIKLGSREVETSNYKEHLTDTLLAGGFVGNNKGKRDWLYYLGETEVQRRQWNAVMRWWDEKNGRTPITSKDDTLFPQTGITLSEIYTFIEALNTWMITEGKGKLPVYRNAKAFCRLPTEAEWEFAARGGTMVLPDIFDRPFPYTDDGGNEFLGGFEWYRSTSGNRVKECGSANLKPNPLGLYDMLGNVEELTLNLFGPEYQQGRFGSLVIRGGNFSTDQQKISASTRTEYLSHTSSGELLRPDKVGFRLALSTRISSSGHLAEELDSEYERYTEKRGLTRPGPSGKSSPTAQATEDMFSMQQTEKMRLNSANDDLMKKISILEEQTRSTQAELSSTKTSLASLSRELAQKDQQLSQALSGVGSQKDDSSIEVTLKEKNEENRKLSNEIEELETRLRQYDDKHLLVTDTNLKEIQNELTRVKQENADLKRRDVQFDDEIDKNRKRVRYVEKRYLEALMRLASYNLYSAFRNLLTIRIKKENGVAASAWVKNQQEAEDMVRDYWNHVVEIADHTEENLFPEVKSELKQWLRDKQAGSQINSLDLLDRHVRDARAGRYHRVQNIYDNLLNEPELQ